MKACTHIWYFISLRLVDDFYSGLALYCEGGRDHMAVWFTSTSTICAYYN